MFIYLIDLLSEPNLAIVPPHYAEGTRHDPDSIRSFSPIVRGIADLRRKRKDNKILAELVYLFCEDRLKYDETVQSFSQGTELSTKKAA